MKFDPLTSTVTLSTGTEFYAYSGRLSPDSVTEELYYGHDGCVDEADYHSSNPLTREERSEIADHMVELWKQWAER